MDLILGHLTKSFLRSLLDKAEGQTESVKAAIAYAHDTNTLLDFCERLGVPLRFWGRFDRGVPVSLPVLRWFLDKKSPNYLCKLVRHHHAKIIWWEGFGAYIGSANLTDAAWYRNLEAGVFLTEDDIDNFRLRSDLNVFFEKIDEEASPLTEELYEFIEKRSRDTNAAAAADRDKGNRFLESDLVKKWSGLTREDGERQRDRQRKRFVDEWLQTLQIMRDIAARVSEPKNLPQWIQEGVPAGAIADQFLHAHYYQRVRKGRTFDYERWFQENRKDPETALSNAILWWRNLESAPDGEDRMLNEIAPRLAEHLKEDSLATLSENDFVYVCSNVHAMRNHALRIPNPELGFSESHVDRESKAVAFGHWLWRQRSQRGERVADVWNYVLYGGPDKDFPDRIWETITHENWSIPRLGISSLGELSGWARPDKFPPRNGRTSKSLRSLGYDVFVHSK